MKYLRAALFIFCQVLTAGYLSAQVPPAVTDNAVETEQPTTDVTSVGPRKLPIDVAGYLAFRSKVDDNLNEHRHFRE